MSKLFTKVISRLRVDSIQKSVFFYFSSNIPAACRRFKVQIPGRNYSNNIIYFPSVFHIIIHCGVLFGHKIDNKFL